jgi:hypothetical protein
MEPDGKGSGLTKMSRKESIKSLVSDIPHFYLDTAHGFSRMQSSSSIIVKVVWLICILATWSLLIFHCNMIMQNFFAMPISTTGRITDDENFKFPAVTICNLNMIRKSEIENRPELAHFKEFIDPNVTFENTAAHLTSKARLRDMFYRTNVCPNNTPHMLFVLSI